MHTYTQPCRYPASHTLHTWDAGVSTKWELQRPRGSPAHLWLRTCRSSPPSTSPTALERSLQSEPWAQECRKQTEGGLCPAPSLHRACWLRGEGGLGPGDLRCAACPALLWRGWGRAHVVAAGEVVHHPGDDVVHPGQDPLLGVNGHLTIAQQVGAADPLPLRVRVLCLRASGTAGPEGSSACGPSQPAPASCPRRVKPSVPLLVVARSLGPVPSRPQPSPPGSPQAALHSPEAFPWGSLGVCFSQGGFWAGSGREGAACWPSRPGAGQSRTQPHSTWGRGAPLSRRSRGSDPRLPGGHTGLPLAASAQQPSESSCHWPALEGRALPAQAAVSRDSTWLSVGRAHLRNLVRPMCSSRSHTSSRCVVDAKPTERAMPCGRRIL